ncbi:MAG: tetratricopeptide repeat protein, partial [Alphaproteobacteria bacterium]|nr:tetratricopeptide repeat protein [Alphaproteobacteria bacterium]
SLLLRRLELKDSARARELYTLATKLDPKYPGAWGGVAWTHLLAARFGWSTSPAASLSKAEELARKALELDANRPGTYILLGHIYLTKGDHDLAVTFGEKSVELSPSGAEALAILAVTYSYIGQPKRAIGLLRKAMRLSPYYPGYYLWALGRAYRLTGDHGRAISAFTQHLKRDPGSLVSRVEIVTTHAELGRMAEAREAAKAVLRIAPNFSTRKWARSLTYKDRAVIEREIAALRKAGLPE